MPDSMPRAGCILHGAAAEGDIEDIESLLARGAEVNAANAKG